MAGKNRPHEVRIIGGKWKRRKLRFHPNPSLRPTLGRARETLFNWLRADIIDAHCLDLFAGSGVLGFEALSQGAAHCTFVEQHPRTMSVITQNIVALQAQPETRTVQMDAMKFLRTTAASFDIVFVDPPFDQPLLLQQSLAHLATHGKPHTLIYAEAPRAPTLQQLAQHHNLVTIKTTRNGDTHGCLLQMAPHQSQA